MQILLKWIYLCHFINKKATGFMFLIHSLFFLTWLINIGIEIKLTIANWPINLKYVCTIALFDKTKKISKGNFIERNAPIHQVLNRNSMIEI